MFNYTFDKGGVYIGNLANYGDKYGVTQYRFAHNYELRNKEFVLCDGDKKHTLTFKCKKYAAIDGVVEEYECLKLAVKTFLVRIGHKNVAVVDLAQGLVTLIMDREYFFGKIEGFEVPEGAEHKEVPDALIETNVAWFLGSERFAQHEFIEAGSVRTRWSPHPESYVDNPAKIIDIAHPIYLVDIEGYGPYYSDCPPVLERAIYLQDYDHMMTVGILFNGGETPMMVSGYAKFMDIEEDGGDINQVGGVS